MVTSKRGQGLVEFALVAPVLLLLLFILLDFSRGIFAYSEMSAAAREAARQAVLQYNRDSNLGSSSTCISPCDVPGVVPVVKRLAAFGYSVQFSPSQKLTTLPSYGTQTGGGGSTPLTISLTGASYNTVYVFAYELDGSTTGRWDCADPNAQKQCLPVRTNGHNMIVVDLKMNWRPVLFRLLNVPLGIPFDAQTVERMEY